jgi:hypothetical protein
MNKELTPKEKAKQLIDRYLNEEINFPYIDSEDGRCIGAGYMTYNSAKQCALIAVDEILNNFGLISMGKQHYCAYYTIQYYEEVKKEIEAL